MKVEDIKKVVIAGVGTMGQQIGAQCAIHGLEVVLYDIDHDILAKAFERIKKLLKSFTTSNRITQKEADAAIRRIRGTTNIGEAAANADLISESVPEDPELKGKVFSQFNALCPDHTIFATNTSTLLPSMFAQDTGRPEKLVAIHFHDVRATDIVDVMAHAGTSEETLNVAIEFAIKIGQVPLVLRKESPGYVFNSMLAALFDAAQTLAANRVTSIEEIDRAWMGVLHTPIGPFGLMDSIGIDTVWKAKEHWANKLNDEQNKKNADFLKEYISKGHLGQKSGQGFYSYPEPAYRNPGFVRDE
jgi:3-hydroxybutyryl-CoA dehydrogenase